MTVPAKDNPYRAESVDSLPYLFAEQDLQHFFKTLEEFNFRGSIVGPHGGGKTTLIESLIKEFQTRHIPYSHCRLMDDGRKANLRRLQELFDHAPVEAILLLDSAGLLNWRDWRWFRKQSQNHKGLIITAHRKARLPTLIECRPKLDILIAIINRLEIKNPPAKTELEALFQKHRGNIRDCLRELYDQYARKSKRRIIQF